MLVIIESGSNDQLILLFTCNNDNVMAIHETSLFISFVSHRRIRLE